MSDISELDAMKTIYECLDQLEADQQTRVLTWVVDKLDLNLSGRPLQSSLPILNENEVSQREGTVNFVAVKLEVKTCRDLLIASAIHLSSFQGKEKFSKSEWVALARDSKYWKTDYTVQTSTNINRLQKAGFINETSKDFFALPDSQIEKYNEILDAK
jgi:hypothetical protein